MNFMTFPNTCCVCEQRCVISKHYCAYVNLLKQVNQLSEAISELKGLSYQNINISAPEIKTAA